MENPKAITTYTKLIEKQKSLLRSEHTVFLKEWDSEELAHIAAHHLVKSINLGIAATNTFVSIGRRLKPEVKDVDILFKIGYCLLYILCKNNYIDLQRSSKFTQTAETQRSKLFDAYKKSIQKAKAKPGDWSPKMFVVNDTEKAKAFINSLMDEIDMEKALSPIAKIYNEKPEEWDGLYHPEFGCLISRPNRRVRRYFNSTKCERVLRAVNKIQSTPLKINEGVLDRLIAERKELLKRLKEGSISEESYKSKYYELEYTISLAQENLGKEVYSAVFLDFRGRLYYGAYMLNRSGSDYAKGLLACNEEYELGAEGWNNLIVAAVDFRGKDGQEKLHRSDKLNIADDELEEFIAVANGCNSWMDADEPVQYLSICIDIAKAVESGDEYKSTSGVFISRDAAQSGPALMGIATQDHNTLKYTNLLDSSIPYSLYIELGKEVRERLNNIDVSSLSDAFTAPESEDLFQQVLSLHRSKGAIVKDARKRFLKMFKDINTLKKWSKYQTMLTGYAAEEWCLAEDCWNRFHEKHDWLTPVACKMLADIFYASYEAVVPPCFQVMKGFKELARIVHKMDEDVLMFGSYSGFPFMQKYYKSKSIDVRVKYKGKNVDFSVKVGNDTRDYHSTVSGTPANTVHSWDKELLLMTVNRFSGPMAVNHDAFFAPAAKVSELDKQLRENVYDLGVNYDLLGDSLRRYNLQPSDIGIVKNKTDEAFYPQNNEFCFA